ncbi:MAG: RNase H1/viroplasmin domain-containing protein, partial [Agathobacter rectalis]
MASKYYAVKKGKVPGIYFNWNDCKAMVDGYPGAVYKSFKTIEEAEKFINGEKII